MNDGCRSLPVPEKTRNFTRFAGDRPPPSCHVRAPGRRPTRRFEELASIKARFSAGLARHRSGHGRALDEVEPLESIVKRFSTTGDCLSARLARRRTALCTGDESAWWPEQLPARRRRSQYLPLEPAQPTRSSKSLGAFRITADYLVHAEELEIKMAQGRKPGEGGQLPAKKVSEYIARIRHANASTR